MTRQRDIERVLDAWFTDGPTEMPDRLFDQVLTRVDRQPQRRLAWLFPRSYDMSPLRFIAAAGVVLAFLAAGIGLSELGRVGTDRRPSPSVVVPTPSPISLGAAQAGAALPPGRYVIDAPFPRRLSFTVPAGWIEPSVQAAVAGFQKETPGELLIAFWTVINTYRDACDPATLLDPPVGPGVGDLVAALTSMDGVVATDPQPVSINGLAGQHVELTRDGECPGSRDYRLWTNASVPGRFDVGQGPLPLVDELWVLDVDGMRVVVDLMMSNVSDADREQARAIVRSIALEP